MANQALPPDGPDRAETNFGTTQLLERAVILLLFGGLVIGVLAVLRPFATAILFGAILAVAAWPMRDFLLRRGLSSGLTALLLLLFALAIIALPIIAIGPGLAERLVRASQYLRAYLESDPQLPRSLASPPGHRRAPGLCGRRPSTPREVSARYSSPTPLICQHALVL